MFTVISYDIPDDRRRGQVADLLLGYGERVQYSVFECDIKLKHFQKLRTGLARLISPQENGVRIYRLCAECRSATELLGKKDDGPMRMKGYISSEKGHKPLANEERRSIA